MAWLWWLSGPVLATVLAACWSWLRSRPARTRTTTESMAEHSDYLDALVQTARSRDRGLRRIDDSGENPSSTSADNPADNPAEKSSERPDDAAA